MCCVQWRNKIPSLCTEQRDDTHSEILHRQPEADPKAAIDVVHQSLGAIQQWPKGIIQEPAYISTIRLCLFQHFFKTIFHKHTSQEGLHFNFTTSSSNKGVLQSLWTRFFISVCRANSLCVDWCVYLSESVGGAYVETKKKMFYPCSFKPSTVGSRIKVATVSDCIIIRANLTPVQSPVIREDIVLTLCFTAVSQYGAFVPSWLIP